MSSAAAGQSAIPRARRRRGRPFRLVVTRDGTTLLLRLNGAFDWACIGRVEAALEQVSDLPTQRVVFDLSALDSLDIAGLRTLLRANERARTEPFDVVVVRPPGLANRIFTLTSAGRELTMVDSVPGRNSRP